jgi:hypothetical protein
MLYEILTGALPFTGSAADILGKKKQEEPPAARTLAAVPSDLDALCSALLRREPEARPSGEEILERLSERRVERRPRLRVIPAAPFLGRRRELDTLARALVDSRRGPVVVVLHGEAGVGKTALAKRFADGASARVVSGRCHERESVPFRALDAIVDDLVRSGAPGPDPGEAALLAPLFPVLGRVAAPILPPEDPRTRRALAFAALRAWLRRLAAAEPLVLLVDDLQWAYADGRALLQEILAAADAPRLLCVCTCRREHAAAVGFLPGDVRHVPVEPLEPEDARELATRLGGAPELADACGGRPLLIEEAVMNARAGAEGAIAARAEGLETAARALLEIAALAGTPLLVDVAARAAGIAPGELGRHVAALRLAGLARTTREKGLERLEPSHDLVREALLEPTWRRSAPRSNATAASAASTSRPTAKSSSWTTSAPSTSAASSASTPGSAPIATPARANASPSAPTAPTASPLRPTT